MIRFVTVRLLQAIPVLLAVGLIAFCLFNYAGDPVTGLLGQDYTEANRLAMVQALGLDQPLLERYGHFLVAAAHGQFGVSYRLGRPVLDLFAERVPATVELAAVATLLRLTVGIPLGIHTAVHPRSAISRLLGGISLLGVSLPSFLTGLLLVAVFSVWLRWLPSFGRGQTVALGGWTTGLLTRSGLLSLVLPALTLGSFQVTLVMRLVHAQMQDALGTEHVRFARARGLSRRIVNTRHALQTASVPVITAVALQFGTTVAFSIVTEQVFQWPGTGLLLVGAVQSADIPVMTAYLISSAVLFLAVNLVADIACFAADPRTRAAA